MLEILFNFKFVEISCKFILLLFFLLIRMTEFIKMILSLLNILEFNFGTKFINFSFKIFDKIFEK